MKSTYTKWEGISNLQSNGMLSELCSGSGDCDFVYGEILKCCLTRVRNLGISGTCLTLGGSWSHVEEEERKGEFTNRVDLARGDERSFGWCHLT